LSSNNEIWAFAEQTQGKPSRLATELTTKAAELAGAVGGTAAAVALGPGAGAAAPLLAGYGADKVYVCEEAGLQGAVAAQAYALAELIGQKQPRLVLIGATFNGKDIAGRVLARRGLGLIGNAAAVEWKDGQWAVTVPSFGGNVNIVSTFKGEGTALVTVRPKAFVAEERAGNGEIEAFAINLPADVLREKVLESVVEESQGPSLEEASVIVSGGRGLGGPEFFATLRELAEALDGAVGASRAAVDAGWIPYAHQVGQTGKTVKPNAYIACGISGAIQHKVGMQTSGVIVAINKNPDAPIFQFADLGIVGDLFDIVPKLIAEVKKRKQA